MPIIDGNNLDGWAFRAERFFNTNCLSEVEKLDAEVINLDGDAIAWFQWADRRRPTRNWPKLKMMIQESFKPTQEGSVYEHFLVLPQVGIVDEYCKQFECLAASLINIPDPI